MSDTSEQTIREKSFPSRAVLSLEQPHKKKLIHHADDTSIADPEDMPKILMNKNGSSIRKAMKFFDISKRLSVDSKH